MEPVAGTPGGSYLLTGNIKCTEDMILTQGMIHKYGDWLLNLLGQKPKAPAGGPKAKSLMNSPKPKSSPPKKTEPRPSTGIQRH